MDHGNGDAVLLPFFCFFFFSFHYFTALMVSPVSRVNHGVDLDVLLKVGAT
jgi:hypothetical protein